MGWNVFRLAPAQVHYDFMSDVPHDVLVPAHARGQEVATADDIRAALAPLCGDALLALATKGRAAEIALVDALELAGPPTVLAQGLFTTTTAALSRRGAVIEDIPRLDRDGTADIDIERLEARLQAGGVALVYLELANNAWFGWPVSEDNVRATREACDRHGARLLLDAARPIANAVALGDSDPVAAVRRILGHAHAFTISCAKELLVPTGSVVGSWDRALIGRAAQTIFKHGTSLTPIDPPARQAELRDGVRYALAHPELVRDRVDLVRELAEHLVRHGVKAIRPVTAHAVYVPLDRALVPPGDVSAMLSLLAHLYVVTGVRAQVAGCKRGPALRLAVPLCTAIAAPDIAAIASGMSAFFGRIGERSALRMLDGGELDVPYFRRFAPV